MPSNYEPRLKKWGRKLKAVTVEVIPGEEKLLKQVQDEEQARDGHRPAKGQLVSEALQAKYPTYRKGYKKLMKERTDAENREEPGLSV